jgi:phosphoribosyl 1,2-cyclic phosphodiesterase
VLASSSAGNSTFIATETTRVLIDAGLSRKEIFQRLAAIGEDAKQLDGILVTHEHSDHVCGLPVMLKHTTAPVFATPLTASTIDWGEQQPRLDSFLAGHTISIGDLDIDTFTIPHDAIDPVGFCVRTHGLKIGIVTDLGYVPEGMRFHLRGVDFLLMESNHDVEMLKVGPYPWSIKQRVMGRKGHLSNDAVCSFIRDGLDSTVNTLVLGHLSEHNNHPAIARISAEQALQSRRLSPRLRIAESNVASEVVVY